MSLFQLQEQRVLKMGKIERPSIDKRIAAKMFDSAKLNRMRIQEIRKQNKERLLMAIKRTCLPIIETDFIRRKDSKCYKCNKSDETYGITYEWHLEPVDVLDDDNANTKGLPFGVDNYSSVKRMLSKITNGIIVQPAKIKMIKYLQVNMPDTPIIYVLKSRDQKLDEILLNFILQTYNLKTAISTVGMDKTTLQNHLNSDKNLIVFMNGNDLDDDEHDEKNQLKNILRSIEYGKLLLQENNLVIRCIFFFNLKISRTFF